MLGLADDTHALLFDLDGVLTNTAAVHTRAWTVMFDTFLAGISAQTGVNRRPFTAADYLAYVDGKPREDGVSSFLLSRGIDLPVGRPADAPTAETVWGLGNRKNELLLKMIADDGVESYVGSVDYVNAAAAADLPMAVVSSSANCRQVLAVTGLEKHFDYVVDGLVLRAESLRGKPEPDGFLRAAEMLGIAPGACAVFEDAIAGVKAGRAGGFGVVVGVNRGDAAQRAALADNGATIVVDDLSELLPGGGEISQEQA